MTDVDDVLNQKPLLRFSIYTACQADSLERVSQNLTNLSQNWPSGEPIENVLEYNDLFWIWVLGAYEVVRTMSQHKDCFSSEKQTAISELKKKLTTIRIPFAKQELQRNRGPIYNENSIAGVSNGLRFEIEGQQIESSDLIDEVISFLESFTSTDIKSSIPTRQP